MASKFEHLKPEILRMLANGETLGATCRALGVSDGVVRDWKRAGDPEYDETFATDYARARLDGYESRADELRDIVRDRERFPDIAERRLVFDHARWELAKCLPKIYGEKVDVTSNGETIRGVIELPAIRED
jgi:hypothetical protein